MVGTKRTRTQTLQAALEKSEELERLRSLRIGPRQDEFSILPKEVRFNLYLMKHSKRKAFQIDGGLALFLKEDFAVKGENFMHFFRKYSEVQDLVCVDYPYGLLFTSERAIRDVLKKDLHEIRGKDLLDNAGKLLHIPCSIVASERQWWKYPHQIGIMVDGGDVKQYMCQDDEFNSVVNFAIAEFNVFRETAEAFNAEFTDDPIERVELEFRAKTSKGYTSSVDRLTELQESREPLDAAAVRMYVRSESGEYVSVRI